MKRHIQKQVTFGLGVVLLAGLSHPSWAQPPGGPEFEGGPGFGRDGGFGRGGFGGPDGGGPGGGRFGGGRNSPKSQLTRWLEGVQRLDANSQTTLSKAQAKKLLAFVVPWRTKKTMTDAEATALHTRLTTVLTVAQKSKLAEGRRFGGPGDRPGGFGGRMHEGDRSREGGPDGAFGDGPPEGGPGDGPGGFGGPRGRGGDGPDGGGFGPPPGGFGGDGASDTEMKARRAKMQAFMKSNNPLASPKSNAQFAKLPEPMRQRILERFKTQSDFLVRLQKKAK